MKHASSYILFIIVAFGLIFSANMSILENNVYAQRSDAVSKLSLFVVPPKVPADGDSYKNIYVAVMNARGNPSVVSDRLEVRLTSSTTSVGTVDGTVYIEPGSYYTVANFHSTNTAGNTVISATATGYDSAQATVTTIKSSDRTPAKLSVIALPSPPLPQQGAEGIVIVQLLNSAGQPAVAKEDIRVVLTSSNEDVIKVDKTVTIPRGQIYAIAKSVTSHGSGQSMIKASADGLVFGTVTVSTGDSSATQLKVYPIPPTISSTGSDGGLVVVQLEDPTGKPVRSSKDIEVLLISSDDRIVTPQQPSVTIRKAQSFAVAKVVPKGNEGKASITAIAEGYLSVTGDVTTKNPAFDGGKRQLAIYSAPPNVSPGATDTALLVVQVQGEGGAPAPVFRTTKIQLSSSNVNLGKLSGDLVILSNESFGVVRLELVGLTGETTITASAPNFQTKQFKLSAQTIGGSGIDLVPTSQNIPAFSAPYPAFLLMLKSGDMPVKTLSDINVLLSASSDLADIPSTVQIPRGSSFTVVNITPKGFPGTLTITAKAEGFKESVTSITLTEFNPSNLAVFTAFPTLLPSSPEGDELVIVQLQNARGEPEKNMVSDTKVSLSLFPSNIGSIEQNLVIPRGANFAAAKIFLNTSKGDGTINVNAEGYKLVSSRFKTISLALDANLNIRPTTININQTSTLTLRVTSENKPVPYANVRWVYDQNAARLISASDKTNTAGEATAVYIPMKDISQRVSAVVSKPGYEQKEAVLTFDLEDKARTGAGPRAQFSLDALSAVLIAAIAGQGLVIYWFYQKKRPLF